MPTEEYFQEYSTGADCSKLFNVFFESFGCDL